MFKVGDRVKDKTSCMEDNPFATVLEIRDNHCLVNWDCDKKSDELALGSNSFWPMSDFELVEESETISEKSADHWLKIERALEDAIDACLDDFRPEDAIKYARMLDDVRKR